MAKVRDAKLASLDRGRGDDIVIVDDDDIESISDPATVGGGATVSHGVNPAPDVLADIDGAVLVRDMTVEINDGGTSRVIVDKLSFLAKSGHVTALVGPSGSGKTTVLSCVAGVAKFQSGWALVGSALRQPDSLAPAKQLREIGVLFQDYRLVKSLNAIDNVALPLRLRGYSWLGARKRAAKMLDQVGLGDRLKSNPSAMSGGEQQRVAFARAVVGRPGVLLADEPSAHLDRESAAVLIELLLGLADEGTCVLLTTHDPELLKHAETVVDLGNR